MIDLNEIGGRIRYLREHLVLRQAEFARLTGIAAPSLSDIEAGKRGCGAITAGRITMALGVSLDWLLTGHAGSLLLPEESLTDGARKQRADMERFARAVAEGPLDFRKFFLKPQLHEYLDGMNRFFWNTNRNGEKL